MDDTESDRYGPIYRTPGDRRPSGKERSRNRNPTISPVPLKTLRRDGLIPQKTSVGRWVFRISLAIVVIAVLVLSLFFYLLSTTDF